MTFTDPRDGKVYLKTIFNAKVVCTILPICLIGIGIMMLNSLDVFCYVCGIFSTIIVVPLMYLFIPVKLPLADDTAGIQYATEPRGIKKIVYGITRGVLGALLIMYLTATLIMVMTITPVTLESEEFSVIDGVLSWLFFTPLILFGITVELYGFILCVIASFIFADYFIKTDVSHINCSKEQGGENE